MKDANIKYGALYYTIMKNLILDLYKTTRWYPPSMILLELNTPSLRWCTIKIIVNPTLLPL
jgi:hypothetical protein